MLVVQINVTILWKITRMDDFLTYCAAYTHNPVQVMLMQTVNTVMSGAEDNISQRVLSPPAVKSPPHKKINVHNMISHETTPLCNVHEQQKATKKPLTAAIREYIFTLNNKNVHTWILYCM